MNPEEKHYAHVALLALGAIAVLWYLMRQSSAAAPAAPPAAGDTVALDSGVGVQQYPSVPPAGDITIGGSPTNLTYNTFEAGTDPTKDQVKVTPAAAADCGCADQGGDCAKPQGSKVSIMRIPAHGLKSAFENFSSAQFKVSAGAASPGDAVII